jgi:hypothetical protein
MQLMPLLDNLTPPRSLPDLSNLTTNSGRLFLGRVFQSAAPKEYRANALQLNAVRLADMALSEYCAGRDAALEFHAKPRGKKIKFFFLASGHFESCIWTLHRFVRHVNVLRRAKFVPIGLKQLVPRHLSFLTSSAENGLTGLRDTLAHLEERALKGKLPPGCITMLIAIQDGLCISDQLMIWDDLVTWLRDVHKCASDIAGYVSDLETSPTTIV